MGGLEHLYKLQLRGENCLKLSVCDSLLCKCGKPNGRRRVCSCFKILSDILFFWLKLNTDRLRNLYCFEKMPYKAFVVCRSARERRSVHFTRVAI